MGFLHHVKSAADSVNGNGVKVSIQASHPSRQTPFSVRVRAAMGEKSLKIKRVYIKIEGQEMVVAKGVEVAKRCGNKVKVAYEDLERVESTFAQEVTIAGAQILQANGTYQWEAEYRLPPDAIPSYRGRNARHEWRIQAGLDVAGNSQDSGWMSLEIR
jgi:hypothetical protein